jgi:hypothetical protein
LINNLEKAAQHQSAAAFFFAFDRASTVTAVLESP